MRSDAMHAETLAIGNGYSAAVEYFYDQDTGAPWEECDGHGVVSEWTTRSKNAGERVLCENRGSRRYYDVQESIRIAKRDGWDAEPYGGTKGERAARAVAADYEYLRAWCNNDWHYVGVQVTLFYRGKEVAQEACWAVETWKDYHGQHARDTAHDMMETHTEERQKAWREALHEARERQHWAYRDVATS